MPANQLDHIWSDRIRQLCPPARKTLVHNFTWLLIGIYLSRRVHLSAIANQLAGSAKLHSTVQRLRRLLQHGICVRKWIEEMFGDMKGHGFNLEDSHLRHFLRLSRLTLAVVLLYVWLITFGSRVIKNGQRSLVDRPERRDFSIFRIRLNMIERLLTNAQPVSVMFVTHF
jgi:uncharacterized protein (UPF0335 family)